jgi:hypothetical protein
MATLLHHHDTLLSRPNRYAGMSQNLLIHKLLESLDQLQNTLKQSRENTRHFLAIMKAKEEKSRHLWCTQDTVSEIVQVLEPTEANMDLSPSASEISPGVLHGDSLDLTTTIEPMDEPPVMTMPEQNVVQLWSNEPRTMTEPPLPLETKIKAPIQLWNSFVFQLSTKSIEMTLAFSTFLELLGCTLRPALVSHNGEEEDTGSFDPATKLAPMDEPSVMVVPEQSVVMPFPLLVNSDHKAQLSFNDRSPELDLVVRKHRWRWKTAAADEDAAVAASTGDIDGRHGTTGVVFPGGSYCSVSMNEGNTMVSIPHPWTSMPFAIPAGTSFVHRRAGGRGLRPWRQIRLASFPRASGRFQNTHLELTPFLGGPHFASFPGASGRSQINRLERGSWTVLGST